MKLKTLLWNRLQDLLSLHQIPGSCMKLVSFVHEKRMVNSQGIPQVKRSLFSGNGTFYSLHRRQSIGRADWEKLPWTGPLCLLFTRAWEIGRMLAWLKKEEKIEAMTTYLDTCRRHWTDWMRGQVEPPGWDERFDIDRENWRERFLLYERDLEIQQDLEYLSEAVFVFYTKHLDKFIRENNKLWGDFCKRKVDRDGNIMDALELNTHGYDMTIPGITVPMNKRTVIPEPERHFSFSTKMMIMAIDLYEDEAPATANFYSLCSQQASTICGQQKGVDSSILQVLCRTCLQSILSA